MLDVLDIILNNHFNYYSFGCCYCDKFTQQSVKENIKKYSLGSSKETFLSDFTHFKYTK